MRRKISALLVTAAAAGATILGASPASAQASQDIWVKTNTPFDSGIAQFIANGEHFYVCDDESDGMRAVANWIAFTPTQTRFGDLQDANGANNGCVESNQSFPEGSKVSLTVCVRDGANGTNQFCATKEGYA